MQVAEWCAQMSYARLPPEVAHHARRVIIDYLAAVVAGSTSASAQLILRFLVETDIGEGATVIGTARRLSAPNAALANGTAAHGLEIDDGYTPGSFHPGAPVLSAVLAAAEVRGSPSDDVLLATAVSYEIACRLAEAGHPATRRHGFHNTPVVGVFGAALGVALILGIRDAHGLATALGIAGSHAGGLFEFLGGQGGEVKRLHAGKAARDGLVAAQLASYGLEGPTTVLEGADGYIRAYAGEDADDFDADGLTAGLGEEWRMLRTYVKPYPCCRHLHGPIDAVLQLREGLSVFDLETIDAIEVATYTLAARHNEVKVDSFLDAQMSIPFAVAVALLRGVPTLGDFDERGRTDPDIDRIMQRVTVRAAAECDRMYAAARPARVTMHLGSRRLSQQVDQPYGEPSNPVSDADLVQKLVRYAGPVIGAQRCAAVADEVWTAGVSSQFFAYVGTTEMPDHAGAK